MNKYKKYLIIFIFLILNLSIFYPQTENSTTSVPKKVLIFNSYHPGNLFSDQEIEGVKSILTSETEYFIEYMDSKIISGNPDYLSLLYNIYNLKYHQKKIDIIISMDDDAFQFLQKFHNNLFPGIPVVFCGVGNLDTATIANKKFFTGVVETIDHKSTIELMLKLHPYAKEIYFIIDNTTSGKKNKKDIDLIADSKIFPVEFKFINTENGITINELYDAVKNLPRNSLINYVTFYQDKTGELLRPDKIIPEISKNSSVPIYAEIGIYLGFGIVGGKLNSGFYQGEIAGQMALKILEGENISKIPILTQGFTKYMFDYKELKRWNIPESNLPVDSVIINKEVTLFEQYRLLIIGILLFTLVETIIVILLIINIIRKHRTEKMLKEKTEELDRYFTSSLDLLCIADTDGYFRRLNPEWEKTLGYSIKELEGKQFFDFVHPDDIESTKMTVNQLSNQKEILNFENRYRCNDGSYRWIEWRSFPIEKTIYAVARDITDRKLAEEEVKKLNATLVKRVYERTAQLEEINKELETFSYSVSHDLQAPLRHIHGFIEILQESLGKTLNKENKHLFNGISESAIYMNELIESLLNFSRMAKNEMDLRKVDMNMLVQDTIKTLNEQTKGRKINWDIKNLPKVKGDALLLRQVWINLISNAIKYTRGCKKTKIEIGYNKNDNKETIFFIKDNGVGFNMKYKDKLFGVFQRLHNRNEFEGIGIGLANVKRIIHRHNGRVWAESEPNKGAVFYFTIPVIDND